MHTVKRKSAASLFYEIKEKTITARLHLFLKILAWEPRDYFFYGLKTLATHYIWKFWPKKLKISFVLPSDSYSSYTSMLYVIDLQSSEVLGSRGNQNNPGWRTCGGNSRISPGYPQTSGRWLQQTSQIPRKMNGDILKWNTCTCSSYKLRFFKFIEVI